MEASEVELIRSSLEQALEGVSAEKLLSLLDELGWFELVEVEPGVAVGELFEAQGRFGHTLPALDVVVADALGLRLDSGQAVVHPGAAWPGQPAGTCSETDAVTIDGLVLCGSDRASRLLVPCTDDGGALVTLEVSAEALEQTTFSAFDPALSRVRVRGQLDVRDRQTTVASWEEVSASARKAIGHELVGVASSMLAGACQHVIDRHQFGRPIGSFQVVRHALADVHVAIAAAGEALAASWIEASPLAADAAKALAGRAALLAARACPQVTGGLGFTFEHPVQAGLRRIQSLDSLYGSASQLTASLGRAIRTSGRVPALHTMA